jgi:hypothetical protein
MQVMVMVNLVVLGWCELCLATNNLLFCFEVLEELWM